MKVNKIGMFERKINWYFIYWNTKRITNIIIVIILLIVIL